MKVNCVESILTPYSIPRFRTFQSIRKGDTVRVMALGATERSRNWKIKNGDLGFDYVEAFPGETVEDIGSRSLVGRVTRWLDDSDPEAVVIAGYYYPAMRAAARWAKAHGRASIVLMDSQWVDRRRIHLKECLKGWWVRRYFDAAFAAGERTAAYLMRMGFPRDRVWTGYDVVDNRMFAEGAAVARSQADSLRDGLGLPKHYFLYVGRFAPEKNLLRMLEAYGAYRQVAGQQAWGLVLVGGGPQESILRTCAKDIRGVVFAGFQQVETLPAYYGLASSLILPSLSEPWGLVVNEALAVGLPVLVSHRCGCVPELVRSGVNGYVLDPFDIRGMARLMGVIASDAADRDTMGEASRRIVALHTPATWAQTLADCIDQTVAFRQGTMKEWAGRWLIPALRSQRQGTESQVRNGPSLREIP